MLVRRLVLGHAYRLKVQLHCCGGFEPLIPALIAAGLAGLHAIQPCCGGMDLAKLKADYGDRIVFNLYGAVGWREIGQSLGSQLITDGRPFTQ